MESNNNQYKKYFSVKKFWEKLNSAAKKAGIKTVYMALLLYFAYARKDTPAWAKGRILGTLGYFLLPLDLLSDLWPIIGYTDDVMILGVCLGTVAAFINDEVKEKAKTQLHTWFGDYNEGELTDVEEKL
jgi:uncharacterized membrane protein YkvA (DUF1232 family)